MTETLDTRALKLLAKLIVEEQDALGTNTMSGSAEDYAKYREKVGRFRAFSDVLKWCEEIEKDLFEGAKK